MSQWGGSHACCLHCDQFAASSCFPSSFLLLSFFLSFFFSFFFCFLATSRRLRPLTRVCSTYCRSRHTQWFRYAKMPHMVSGPAAGEQAEKREEATDQRVSSRPLHSMRQLLATPASAGPAPRPPGSRARRGVGSAPAMQQPCSSHAAAAPAARARAGATGRASRARPFGRPGTAPGPAAPGAPHAAAAAAGGEPAPRPCTPRRAAGCARARGRQRAHLRARAGAQQQQHHHQLAHRPHGATASGAAAARDAVAPPRAG